MWRNTDHRRRQQICQARLPRRCTGDQRGSGAIHHCATVTRRLHTIWVNGSQPGKGHGVGGTRMTVEADRLTSTRQADTTRLTALQFKHFIAQGDDFIPQPAAGLGAKCLLVTIEGIAVHCLTAQAIILGQVFRRGDHVHAGSRVVQRFPEKILELDRRPQAESTTMGVGGNRVAGHGLGAHTQRQFHAVMQLPGSLAQQFKPCGANTLHRQGRHLLCHTAVEADMTRQHVRIKTGLSH